MNTYARALLCCSLLATGSSIAQEPDWVPAMRRVHQQSSGQAGVLLHVGDSITYSLAYFAPLQYARDARMNETTREAWSRVDAYLKPECYRWKGGDKGNYSGQTAAWGVKNIDRWIEQLQPEAALIMFGTNDIRRGTVEQHEADLRALIQRCLDRGVVVILSTIPPMHAYDQQVRMTVEAQRRVAAEMHVPLIDFYQHVLNRRPDDWDGASTEFEGYSQWEVPTLISGDGVHPSNPKQWTKDYTEEGLCRNGNTLRTYLTLLAYAEVIDVVFREKRPSEISRTVLGIRPPVPKDLPEVRVPSEESTQASLSLPVPAWFPTAPKLPGPKGEVIRVHTVPQLYAAAKQISAGGTILIGDGHYPMPETLVLQKDGVCLRSESGQRTQVVLDFANCRHHEGIAISRCQNTTIADLTVQNVRQNGIKINSNLGTDRVTIYNVVSHNVWQRHVKGPAVPDEDGQPRFVEACQIRYCVFYNDRRKQRGDEPWEDSNPRMGFNYIGGIDVMNARDWQIADNVFSNIRGQTGEARGAIFFWHNSTACTVERNLIIDCDSGICLGNSSARGDRRHASQIQVRNNFVVRCHENNILADHTRDCRIEHNSVHDPESRNGRLLRVVHANDGLVAANNLFSGPRIVVEQTEGKLTLQNNLVRPVAEYFLDATRGDLHLKANADDAIDRGEAPELVTEDIDRDPRDDRPDLGADEWVPVERETP